MSTTTEQPPNYITEILNILSGSVDITKSKEGDRRDHFSPNYAFGLLHEIQFINSLIRELHKHLLLYEEWDSENKSATDHIKQYDIMDYHNREKLASVLFKTLITSLHSILDDNHGKRNIRKLYEMYKVNKDNIHSYNENRAKLSDKNRAAAWQNYINSLQPTVINTTVFYYTTDFVSYEDYSIFKESFVNINNTELPNFQYNKLEKGNNTYNMFHKIKALRNNVTAHMGNFNIITDAGGSFTFKEIDDTIAFIKKWLNGLSLVLYGGSSGDMLYSTNNIFNEPSYRKTLMF